MCAATVVDASLPCREKERLIARDDEEFENPGHHGDEEADPEQVVERVLPFGHERHGRREHEDNEDRADDQSGPADLFARDEQVEDDHHELHDGRNECDSQRRDIHLVSFRKEPQARKWPA